VRGSVAARSREGSERSTVRRYASSRSSGSSPSRGADRQGQGGAGCRREGARARRSVRKTPRQGCGWGWWLAHASAREALNELGHRLSVMCGFDRPRTSTDPGFANPGVGVRIAACNRNGWAPGGSRGTRLRPSMWVAARDRTWNRGGADSGGYASQESTGVRLSSFTGRGSSERTPGGSKASKRAWRPLTGEPSVRGKGTARAAHASALRRPA
jgi:hypothetical protein